MLREESKVPSSDKKEHTDDVLIDEIGGSGSQTPTRNKNGKDRSFENPLKSV